MTTRRLKLEQWLGALLASSVLVGCGGGDGGDAAPPIGAPAPAPGPAPAPAPPPGGAPAPAPAPFPAPSVFVWISPTAPTASVQLVRNGSTGTAEGVTYTFQAGGDGRITVSGGAVAATRSALSERGAVLQLCRVAGTSGAAAILVDATLAALGPADLDGKTFDELRCESTSGEFVTSGSFATITAGRVTKFENASTQAYQEQSATLLGPGSTIFQSEIGILRWRAYRRPDGGIVIVESQTGASGPGTEPAAVRLFLQR